MPLHEHLEAAVGRLRAAGVRDPVADAARLAAFVFDLDDPRQLPADAPLTGDRRSDFETLVARRADRVPLPHLTGRVRVRDVDLEVGPGVFVPQPETEAVIAWCVAALDADDDPTPIVADLCCGAGTIAFSLAHEVPRATVHAVERDPGAVRWARRNAVRLAAAGDRPVTVHHEDVDGCLPELAGQLTLVASNPPYVATSERDVPDPEVVDHDPAIALWAGEDGLDLVRLVERAARRLLRPGGQVVVEHSDRQGRSAPAVFERAGGWDEIADHLDQEGRDRFVTARWRGAS